FSIPIIIKEEKQHLLGYYKNVLFVFLAILLVLFISFFNPSASTDGVHYSLNNFSLPLAIYVFFCGMIAISAMVLPGISGSTLLLIFGLYGPIINALKETLTFNFSYLPILIVFGLGVLSGIFISIRLIKWLLTNYRSKMIYLILGLMIGSIYAVFIGPTTLDIPKPAMNLESFNFIFFAIGGSLIYGLNLISNRFK
ncbi:DUF368 domain-containing protein, partial [Clostridium sp.]|uniref:DUF368 domain-containing protein n=1 Tax=Clostridium sp. TaxID=1506 RepID=UPI003F3E5B9D